MGKQASLLRNFSSRQCWWDRSTLQPGDVPGQWHCVSAHAGSNRDAPRGGSQNLCHISGHFLKDTTGLYTALHRRALLLISTSNCFLSQAVEKGLSYHEERPLRPPDRTALLHRIPHLHQWPTEPATSTPQHKIHWILSCKTRRGLFYHHESCF